MATTTSLMGKADSSLVSASFKEAMADVPADLKDVYDKKTTILISSYEFSYDIEKKLNNEFPSAEYYKLYTGYTRNLSYYFSTKKN